MSLQTALSGLDSAQTGLNTVSNDLANASTTAFKSQTALFQDVYPTGETNVPGYGAQTEGMSTDLSEGDLTSTGNPLDAAIQGNGYFIVSQNGTQQYTRDGAFQLSTNGQLETLSGNAVMGYATNAAGGVTGALGPLTLNTGAMGAQASSNIGLTLNLNSGDAMPGSAFNPADPTTYEESTSVVTYDSLGNANRAQLYFVQQPPSGPGATPSWDVYAQMQNPNGTNVTAAPSLLTTLTFSSSGAMTGGSPASLAVNWGNGAANSNLSFNFSGTTLAAQNFAVAGTTNDGYAPGAYSGTSIGTNGDVTSTYSNGQTLVAGRLAIANFINPEGLEPISGNMFGVTQTSGQPLVNTPGAGLAGNIAGGSLEASNASTSSLLVSLIQYQQAYQANTSVLQTEQQDSQRLVQI